MNKKNVRRIISAFIVISGILLISFLVEIFGYNKLSGLYDSKKIIADEEYLENENMNVLFSYDGEYVKEMSFSYSSDLDINYQIIVTEYDGYGKLSERAINDVLNNEFNKAITNINSKVRSIRFIFSNSDFSVKQITVSNQLNVNWYRILFFIALLSLIAFLIFARNIIEHRLEIAFAVICLISGFLIIVYISPDLKSWDEQIHFNNVYNQSFSGQIDMTSSSYNMNYLLIPSVNTYKEKQMLNQYMNYNGKVENSTESISKGKFIEINCRGYIAQSMMMKIARGLNLPFVLTIIFGKLGNLILYVLFVFFAIKYATVGKRVIAMIALLPTPIFLASSFSYDPPVLGACILAFSIFVSELMEPDKKLSLKAAILFVFAMVFASFPKAVYIPLILLALFFHESKFNNKRNMYIFKIGIIVIFILMMSTFILPTLSGEVVGDLRGGETSVSGQLAIIMKNPLTYSKLLLQHIIKAFFPYMIGTESTLNYAYLGSLTGAGENVGIIVIVLIAFVTLTNNEVVLSFKNKVIIATILFGVTCLIWTALYLSFTPVGLNTINGVSPRYYLPLTLPFLFLFGNRSIKCEFTKLKYNRIMLTTLVGISFYTIYELVLKQYYF